MITKIRKINKTDTNETVSFQRNIVSNQNAKTNQLGLGYRYWVICGNLERIKLFEVIRSLVAISYTSYIGENINSR
jgi:hypothetical protein